MNARKLPSGRWQSKVYIGTVDGKKQFRTVTEDTRRECLIKAAQILEEAKAQKQAAAGEITVSQAVTRYIDSRRGVISPATIRGYMDISKRHIQEMPIGAVTVSGLTLEKVQSWVSSLAEKGLSKKTVKNAYAVFSPAVAMFHGPKFEVEFPKGQKYKGYVPSTEEVQKVIKLAAEMCPDLYRACLLAACSTLRRGEIACLTRDDINGNILHVGRDMVRDEHRNWVIKNLPKEEASVRDIPLPKSIISKMPASGRLVNLTPDQITAQFEKVLAKADVPSFRFHDLRKYSVSLMATEGVSFASIKDIGGWSNINTPQQIYIKTLADAHEREMTRYLDRLEAIDF